MTEKQKDSIWDIADTVRGAGFALHEMALHKMSHEDEHTAKIQANRLLEAADKLHKMVDEPDAASRYRQALIRISSLRGEVMYEDAMAASMREIARIALEAERKD